MDGLTIEQEQEYNRDKKVAAYLAEKQTVVDTYLPLKNKQTLFVSHIQELEILVTGKVITTTGLTEGKGNQKRQVGEFYEGVCGVCRSFLIDKGDTTMAANFNITKAKIVHMPDGDVLPLIIQLNKWITDLLIPDAAFNDYEIDAATVSAGAALATAFNTSIGKAGAIESGKGAAGEDVEAKVEVLRKDITSLDLLARHFISSNSSFYHGFQNAKVIDDIGVHHTGIKGDVTFGGVVVKDAIVTCAALGKRATTNLLGHYEIVSMKPGLYEFTCTSPTAGTLTQTLRIKKGKTIEVDWNLPGTGSGTGNTVNREGTLPSPGIAEINLNGVHGNSSSTLIIVLSAMLRVYAAANSTDPPGSTFIDIPAGTNSYSLDEFATLVGFDSTKIHLLIQNIGMSAVTYKFTFNNV